MMQKTNSIDAQRMGGRSPRPNAAPPRKDASEKNEGTRGPQESWRSPEDDASDEPGVEEARHYPCGPDFAEMQEC
jgi:hypothetical protein